MKKIITLLMVLIMIMPFAACGSKSITMQEIVDANKVEALLDKYNSVSIRNMKDGEVFEEFYLTKDSTYENYMFWEMYTTGEIGYYCADEVYQRLVYMTSDGFVSNEDYRADLHKYISLVDKTVLEKIQSVTQKDGKITVKTALDEQGLKQMADLYDGATAFSCEYLLDEKTHALLSANVVLTYNDGVTYNFVTEYAYNTEMPEKVKPFAEYANRTEDLRTVTVIFNAGTEKEKVEKIQAPIGMMIGLALPGISEERYEIYADAAYTQLFTDSSGYTADETVYIKWIK